MIKKKTWILAVDTREQKPLAFAWPHCPATLSTGDYSIVGFTDDVTIERKSLADLVHTVIHDQERFKQELKRLQTFSFKCIVIESDLRALFRKSYWGKANPMSVMGLILSYMIDYDIPVLFCSTREIAAKVIVSFLKRVYHRLILQKEHERSEADASDSHV